MSGHHMCVRPPAEADIHTDLGSRRPPPQLQSNKFLSLSLLFHSILYLFPLLGENMAKKFLCISFVLTLLIISVSFFSFLCRHPSAGVIVTPIPKGIICSNTLTTATRRLPIHIAFFAVGFYADKKWPSWLPLYIRACEANQNIASWFIISNIQPPQTLSSTNVHFIESSVEDISARLFSRSGLNATLHEPDSFYKLGSDYHSVIADLFWEYASPAQGFTHWAHTDLDVFYGNLSRFLTPRLLSEFDIISAHQQRFCGPFTIFRNIPEVVALYRSVPGVREVFLNGTFYCGFDELMMSQYVATHTSLRVKWMSPVAAQWEDVLQFYFDNCAITNCKAAYCLGEVFNFMLPSNHRMLIHMSWPWQAVVRKAIDARQELLQASCWYIGNDTMEAFLPRDITY